MLASCALLFAVAASAQIREVTVQPLPAELAAAIPKGAFHLFSGSGRTLAWLAPAGTEVVLWRSGKLEVLALPPPPPTVGAARMAVWDDRHDRLAVLAGAEGSQPAVWLADDRRWQSTPELRDIPGLICAVRGRVLVGTLPTPKGFSSPPPGKKEEGEVKQEAEVWRELVSSTSTSWTPFVTSPLSKVMSEEAEARRKSSKKPVDRFSTATETASWSASILVPRSDGRYWLVNRYAGDLAVLSTSGAVQWEGRLDEVRPAGWSDDQKKRILDSIGKTTGQRPESMAFSSYRPVVFAAASVEDHLLVLADTPGGRRLFVVSAYDQVVRVFRVPSPYWILGATEDGVIVVGPRWEMLDWEELRPAIGPPDDEADAGAASLSRAPAPGCGTSPQPPGA